MAKPRRSVRVADLLKRELGDILTRDIDDPAIGFVTITRVEVSRDLRAAKIFVSILDHEQVWEQTRQALERASSFIRREISQRIHLRYVPELSFKNDTSGEYAMRINQVIKEIKIREGRAD